MFSSEALTHHSVGCGSITPLGYPSLKLVSVVAALISVYCYWGTVGVRAGSGIPFVSVSGSTRIMTFISLSIAHAFSALPLASFAPALDSRASTVVGANCRRMRKELNSE